MSLDDESWVLRYHMADRISHLAPVKDEYWRQQRCKNWLLLWGTPRRRTSTPLRMVAGVYPRHFYGFALAECISLGSTFGILSLIPKVQGADEWLQQLCVYQLVGTPSAECCSKSLSPTRVTRWFISNSQGIGLEADFFFSSSSDLQSNFFAFCP
jgi:hypothetical protein